LFRQVVAVDTARCIAWTGRGGGRVEAVYRGLEAREAASQDLGRFLSSGLGGGAGMSDYIWGYITGVCTVVFGTLMIVMLTSCSTRSIIITPDGINATSSAFLYCPEATVTRIADGNRTADMIGETSGVGAVVTGVLKP